MLSASAWTENQNKSMNQKPVPSEDQNYEQTRDESTSDDAACSVSFSPRYLAIARNVMSREVVIRVTSEDGSKVEQLNDVEISQVRAALREYGLRQLGASYPHLKTTK